ncbi:MAG: hypothetical protein KGH66_03745, partial [Candidatus Micrarchaeota archaeon]|nr:hypothetical protein [Candidatus Micrarchaeota archaeon]
MMAPIILSIGAIYALIPLVVIVVLIAAAAGLARGASIFQFFGFDALIGLASGVGAGAAGKGLGSKSHAFKSDKQEQLLEATRGVHKARSGSARGERQRDVVFSPKTIRNQNTNEVVFKPGFNKMATAKEKERAITARKTMLNLAGASKEDIANVKASTLRQTKSLMAGVRGSRTGVGMAIPEWMANRSRVVEKLKYTGPNAASVTAKAGAIGAVTGTYASKDDLRKAWENEDRSLNKIIKESKKERDATKEKEEKEAGEA